MKAFNILNRRLLFSAFFVAFCLVSVLPLLVFGLGLIRKAEDELKSSLNENNYLVSRQLSNELDAFRIVQWTDLLNGLAASLASGRRGGQGGADAAVDQAFRQTGELVVLSVRTGRGAEAKHYINQPFMDELKRQDQGSLTLLFSFSTDSTAWGAGAFLGKPVFLDSNRAVFLPIEAVMKTSQTKSVSLRGVFRLARLFEFIDTDLPTVHRQIYVLEGDGTVLFRNRYGRFRQGEVLPYPIGFGSGQRPAVFQTLAFTHEDRKYLGYCYPMPRTGWLVVVVYPKERAYALVLDTRRQILTTIGVALSMSLVLSFLFAWFHSSVIVYAKEALQRYAGKLEQSNLELEAFATSVSHDMSAPLRHIMGYADILEMRLAPSLDSKSLNHLQNISQAAKHLHAMVVDVLVFSKMGHAEIHKTRIELGAMVDAVLAKLEIETAGRQIEWKMGPGATLWGDSTMLQQVLTNLFSNAVKFTRTREKAVVEVGAWRQGDETVVYVRDNGVGFDSREKHKLFGMFQRLHTREEYEGSGVGLAYVRRIIAKHGGRTWAEGEVGAGAVFYFSLPVEGSTQPHPEAHPDQRGELP